MFIVSLLVINISTPAFTQRIEGTIVDIADGDTLTLLDTGHQQHKMRIGGIDAPVKAQPYGMHSKRNLSDLAYRKQAKADCYKTDRYGREVCTFFVDGKDVGLEQIMAGMAWWFRRYASEQATARYR